MKTRFYRAPMLEADLGTTGGSISSIAGLDAFLGGSSEGEGESTAAQTGSGTQPDTQAQNTQTQASGTQGAEQPATQPQVPQNPTNTAFAQMRVANKQMSELLEKVAKSNGIEYNDMSDLMKKLDEKALEAQAKENKVPVELLQRLQSLEQQKQLHEQEQLKATTLIGFQKLKDTYSLSDEQLRSYAAELDKEGLNPFLNPMDIEKDYKTRHFDDIVNMKIQDAVKQALATNTQANNHSTVPSSTQGTGASNGATISTVAGLDALLNSVK